MSGDDEFGAAFAPRDAPSGDRALLEAAPANDAALGNEAAPGAYVIPLPTLPLYVPDSPGAVDHAPHFYPTPPGGAPAWPERVRRIPNVGHAFIFFLIAVIVMVAGEGLTTWGAKSLHLLGNASWQALATDARLSIPSQAAEYLAIFGVSAALFGMLWQRPFLQGIHWNAQAVHGKIRWLVLAGIVLGFGVGLGGDFLPMPKDAPIAQDIMNSTLGAWLMFLFSFTGAPLMEELAFRGFMLPSAVNAFRWFSDNGALAAGAVRWIGVPLSVILTSGCFALMHSPQVSHSWAPVMLIGVVSLVLCIVRLRLDSVLASAVVHSAYNFTLFAGMLVATDGFRHLDKLKG